MRTLIQATAAATLFGLFAISMFSQNPGIQRTVVLKSDVSVPGREAVVARVELAPGASAGRHTHAGEEITYVIEGEVEVLIDGQPAKKVKAGEAFLIPSGAVHDARNQGTVAVKMSGVYVVEKGKPLATPVN